MSKRLFFFAGVFLLLLLSVSCTGKRKIREKPQEVKPEPAKEIVEEKPAPKPVPKPVFKASQFGYKWFSSRIAANVQSGSDEFNLSFFLVVAKDSILYLSCNKLGVEVGRLVCTPDSLKLLVHLNGSYWTGSYADLKLETGVSVSYDMIQALLTDNDMTRYPSNFQKFSAENGYSTWVDHHRKYTVSGDEVVDRITLDSNGRIYDHTFMQQNYSVTVRYRNLSAVENSVSLFPANVNVSIPKADFVLKMQYKTPKINVKGPTSFRLPAKYKRIKISDFK